MRSVSVSYSTPPALPGKKTVGTSVCTEGPEQTVEAELCLPFFMLMFDPWSLNLL